MKDSVMVMARLAAATMALTAMTTPASAAESYPSPPSEMKVTHEAWEDGDVTMSWSKPASIGWYSYDLRYAEISPREFAAAANDPKAVPETFGPSVSRAFSFKWNGEQRVTLTIPQRPPIASRDGDLYVQVSDRHFKLDDPLGWDNDMPISSETMEGRRKSVVDDFARRILGGDKPKIHGAYVPTAWDEFRGWWNGTTRCLGYWWAGTHVDVDWCRVN